MTRAVTVRLTGPQAVAVVDCLKLGGQIGNRAVNARAKNAVVTELFRPRTSPNQWHADLMAAFYETRDLWTAARERDTALHPGDLTDWLIRNPAPRLGDFMIKMAVRREAA